MTNNETGKTKDSGYQVGVRKTFDIDSKKAWDFLFSNEGLNFWLGKCIFNDFTSGKPITTNENIQAKLTTLKLNSHVRMKWKKQNWENESIVQVRVIGANAKATVSFHQEKLTGAEQRAEMKEYWSERLDHLNEFFRN